MQKWSVVKQKHQTFEVQTMNAFDVRD